MCHQSLHEEKVQLNTTKLFCTENKSLMYSMILKWGHSQALHRKERIGWGLGGGSWLYFLSKGLCPNTTLISFASVKCYEKNQNKSLFCPPNHTLSENLFIVTQGGKRKPEGNSRSFPFRKEN